MSINRVELLRDRLRAHKGRFPAIAEETGLGIDWLRKFAQGRFKDVGVARYDTLEEWLDANGNRQP
jgi:hypothetical protein